MPYIIELEPDVWVAPWGGDPGRTVDVFGRSESIDRGPGPEDAQIIAQLFEPEL